MKKKNLLILSVFFLLLILAIDLFQAKSPVYVLITIDTEQDLVPFLETYYGIEKGVPKLLSLFADYDVKATFFVTGDVALKYPELVLRVKNNGHEIGCHGMYHEDFIKLNDTEKKEIIKIATITLENITKDKVVSFRAPYHSADIELIKILQSNGYLVEASATGKFSYPYHPSEDDWLKEGNMSILRVPISLTPTYFYPSPLYNRSWIQAYQYVILSQTGKGVKIVVIGLHSWEVIKIDAEGHGDYTRATGNYTFNNLQQLLEYLKDENIKYITMNELYALVSSEVR